MCKRSREKLTTRDRSSGCRPAKKTFPYPGNRPPLLATRDNPAEKGEIINYIQYRYIRYRFNYSEPISIYLTTTGCILETTVIKEDFKLFQIRRKNYY